MKMTRRKAVFGITVAALGSAALPAPGLFEVTQPDSLIAGKTAPCAEPNEVIDDRLSRDIARMAFRADSEEGVPVLLACINQVVGRSVSKAAAVKLVPWNAQIAGEIRQDAAAWQRIRPNCPVSDVAHLIQVVAQRDISAGGMERSA